MFDCGAKPAALTAVQVLPASVDSYRPLFGSPYRHPSTVRNAFLVPYRGTRSVAKSPDRSAPPGARTRVHVEPPLIERNTPWFVAASTRPVPLAFTKMRNTVVRSNVVAPSWVHVWPPSVER